MHRLAGLQDLLHDGGGSPHAPAPGDRLAQTSGVLAKARVVQHPVDRRPQPSLVQAMRAATPGWSLVIGRATRGTPCASDSSVVFRPACVIVTAARASRSSCGAD